MMRERLLAIAADIARLLGTAAAWIEARLTAPAGSTPKADAAPSPGELARLRN